MDEAADSSALFFYSFILTAGYPFTYPEVVAIGENYQKKHYADYAENLKLYKGFFSGRGTDFAIQPSGSIDRTYVVETLTSIIV